MTPHPTDLYTEIPLYNQRRKDTFQSRPILLQSAIDLTPIDLTDSVITAVFRQNRPRGRELHEGNIIIDDPATGIFKIEPFVLDFEPCAVLCDVKISFPDGTIRRWIRFTFNISETTNP